MLNRNYCGSNKYPQNARINNSANEYDRYKLPAINNGVATVSNTNSTCCKPVLDRPCVSPYTNLDNATKPRLPLNCEPSGSTVFNASAPFYSKYKTNCPPNFNSMQQTPANRGWSSNECIGLGKTTTDSINISSGQKTVVRDRRLADEILQKAGIPSNSTANDCLEVITNAPVTINDSVNCDPNPLCIKRPADCQECYEQSIVVRHLQPPRPPVPPPIIIREHCAPQPPPQSPIIVRQIPPRPSTPPPLIIRECPPSMPDTQEPTIIEREVPPPPPPPRQVIVEQLPIPPPKPRPIILEKWLPYEEPEDRPCIIEKAVINKIPPPKNLIIQYEAMEPRIQAQCINEGITYVDPKQFINEKLRDNAEVFYVDQINNLPDHIKCQLGPQALAALDIQNSNTQTTGVKPYVIRTNQHSRISCPSTSRLRSASTTCLPQHNTNMLARPGNQDLTRAHYNPWATTYQVSYTNKK